MIDRETRRISVRAGLEKGSTDFQPGSRQAKCLFYFRHRGPHLTDIIDFILQFSLTPTNTNYEQTKCPIDASYWSGS